MADHIQFDGKTYVPLVVALDMSGMPEVALRNAAHTGRVWLRTAGRKTYVELESLQQLMHAPLVEPEAEALPIPEPAPVIEAAMLPEPSPLPTVAVSGKKSLPVPAARELPIPQTVSYPAGALRRRPIPVLRQRELPSRSILSRLGTAVAVVVFVAAFGVAFGVLTDSQAIRTIAQIVVSRFAATPASQTAAAGSFGALVSSPTYATDTPSQAQAAFTDARDASSTPQPIYYVYNYPVIERVEYEIRNSTSTNSQEFSQQITNLYNTLEAQIQSLSAHTSTGLAQNYQVISQTNHIDKLDGVTITNAHISGGSLSDVGGSISLSDENTWTALQNFANGINITSGCLSFSGTCAGTAGSGTAGQLAYYANDGVNLSATSSIFIAETGNIGIGTTSPRQALTVAGKSILIQNDVAPALRIRTADNVGSADGLNLGVVTTANDVASGSSVGDVVLSANAASSALHLGTSAIVRLSITGGGNVGIGTTTPYRKLSVTDQTSSAQFDLSYDTTRDAQIKVDSSGDLNIEPSGNDVFLNNDNLWVCTGGSISTPGCPSGNPTGQGNLIVENKVGIGTTTPNDSLVVSGGNIVVSGGNLLLDNNYALKGYNAASTTAYNLASINNSDIATLGSASLGANVQGTSVTLTSTSGSTTLTSAGYFGVGTSSPAQQLATAGMLFVGANGATTLGTATSTFYGDIKIVGKLDVSTIDPVYTIDGVKYATYGSSQVGVKEEVSFKTTPSIWDAERKMYVYKVDFNKLVQGSDLWLFYQITDLGQDWDNLVVTVTPGFDGRAFYEENAKGGVLNIYASQNAPVSVRLVGNRFDFTKWQNLRPDQDGNTEGTHVISSKPVSETAQ